MEQLEETLKRWYVKLKYWHYEVLLHPDGVTLKSEVVNSNSAHSQKYTFEKIWEVGFFDIPVDVQQEICIETARVCADMELPLKQTAIRDFWTHINLSAITPFVLEFSDNYYSHKNTYHLDFSAKGVLWIIQNYKNEFISMNKDQTLADFWFKGPAHPLISTEHRQHLRKVIYDALEEKAEALLIHACPVFDYSKIKSKNWSEDNGHEGIFINVLKDRVESGGWDRGGGGSNFVSFENYWYLAQNAGHNDAMKGYILGELKNAIINE